MQARAHPASFIFHGAGVASFKNVSEVQEQLSSLIPGSGGKRRYREWLKIAIGAGRRSTVWRDDDGARTKS